MAGDFEQLKSVSKDQDDLLNYLAAAVQSRSNLRLR